MCLHIIKKLRFLNGSVKQNWACGHALEMWVQHETTVKGHPFNSQWALGGRRVHFLLILFLHGTGKGGDLDTQSEGSNVELSQTQLSNLGLAGYETEKPRTES